MNEQLEEESSKIPNYILFYLISFTRVRYTTRDLFPEYLGMHRDKFTVYLRSLCGLILSEIELWNELGSFSVIALNLETHNWVVVEPEFSKADFEKKALDRVMGQVFKQISDKKKTQEANNQHSDFQRSDPNQKQPSNYEMTTNLQRGKLASLRNAIKNVKRSFYKKF